MCIKLPEGTKIVDHFPGKNEKLAALISCFAIQNSPITLNANGA
jgi:hypothetical protein